MTAIPQYFSKYQFISDYIYKIRNYYEFKLKSYIFILDNIR